MTLGARSIYGGWADAANLTAIRGEMRRRFRGDVAEVRMLIRERWTTFATGINRRLRARGRTERDARWIIRTALHAEGRHGNSQP